MSWIQTNNWGWVNNNTNYSCVLLCQNWIQVLSIVRRPQQEDRFKNYCIRWKIFEGTEKFFLFRKREKFYMSARKNYTLSGRATKKKMFGCGWIIKESIVENISEAWVRGQKVCCKVEKYWVGIWRKKSI